MRNKPGPYLWLTGGIILLIIVGIQANRKRDPPKKSARIVTERKTPEAEAVRKEEKKVISEFVTKYAGEYSIKVDDFYSPGVDEKLFLFPNGDCEWHWIEGGRLQSAKTGYWTAEKGRINTVIRGNSGDIPEDFTYTKGAFRNGHRFIKLLRKL